MAKSFDSATQAQLDAGQSVDRYVVRFEFDEGDFGFWGGIGVFTYDDGDGDLDYIGAGGLITAEEFVEGVTGEAIPLVLMLSGIPNSELSPDVLAEVENYTYHQRPVRISTAYFDADDGTLQSVELERIYFVDRIIHQHTVGGEAVLRVECESKARDNFKSGTRMRTDADQRLIDADDGGLRYTIEAATVPIAWGRAPEETAQESKRDRRRRRLREIFGGGGLGIFGR